MLAPVPGFSQVEDRDFDAGLGLQPAEVSLGASRRFLARGRDGIGKRAEGRAADRGPPVALPFREIGGIRRLEASPGDEVVVDRRVS